MATTLSSTLIPSKYKDDFRDSDGYYRILFNSGRVLQARELTQIQTIRIFSTRTAIKLSSLK